MMRACAFLLSLLFVTSAAAEIQTIQGTGAVLRALDKLSGRVVDISIPQGGLARFQDLEIILTECRYPEGNPSGDAFAGLLIQQSGEERPVFVGWMIASSPALHAMEHARFDIWVMRCTLPEVVEQNEG